MEGKNALQHEETKQKVIITGVSTGKESTCPVHLSFYTNTHPPYNLYTSPSSDMTPV